MSNIQRGCNVCIYREDVQASNPETWSDGTVKDMKGLYFYGWTNKAARSQEEMYVRERERDPDGMLVDLIGLGMPK